MLPYAYAIAFLANTFAMPALLILLGFAGRPEMAADFGIVHGASVALLLAFSGNARSIILGSSGTTAAGTILRARAALVIPLGVLAWLLSSSVADVDPLLASILVFRRCAEWLAEVEISMCEARGTPGSSITFIAAQSLLLILCALALITDARFAIAILAVWAVSPLAMCAGLTRVIRISSIGVYQLLPHFGASAIVGIAVYAFRLMIVLLVGKTIAGDLFAAFAIGSVFGSVFTQAIGPTLMLRESRGDAPPWWLNPMLGAITVAGLAMLAKVVLDSNPSWLGKADLFWIAAGSSLVGGTIMVLAQGCRMRILQNDPANDVFGPEVMVNVLIVAAVPYVYFLGGVTSLAFLYFLNALLALAFFWTAERGTGFWANNQHILPVLRTALLAMLTMPVFFTLENGIFRDSSYNYDPAGSLKLLPIPLSVIACYAGILILSRYHRARLSLSTLFFTFMFMLVSGVLVSQGHGGQEQSKLILLIQFVLPMFGLVFGQQHELPDSRDRVLPATLLRLLMLLVPLMILVTWIQGRLVITPYYYVFSIYQHLQYVPVILVALYLVSFYSLWGETGYRRRLLVTGLLMGIYAAATVSTVAMGALVAGVAVFAFTRRAVSDEPAVLKTMAVLLIALTATYFSFASGRTVFADKYALTGVDTSTGISTPLNVKERMDYWRFYGNALLASPHALMLGYASPPDRIKNPSAHNYYLDFTYNFGAIALMPMAALLLYTVGSLWRHRRRMLDCPPLFGLALAVLFLVVVDNSLKVGMRQPYPGIITFFLWGVLLGKLRDLSQKT